MATITAIPRKQAPQIREGRIVVRNASGGWGMMIKMRPESAGYQRVVIDWVSSNAEAVNRMQDNDLDRGGAIHMRTDQLRELRDEINVMLGEVPCSCTDCVRCD